MNSFTGAVPQGQQRPVARVLNTVRSNIAVDDDVMKEARCRRDLVRKYAEQFVGALRSFNSGSLAHGTANDPLKDADGGVVLDRRIYPQLGPDGSGAGPSDIVDEVARFIEARLLRDYLRLKVTVEKRAILFEFNSPMDDEDPCVDLIVGLTRRDAPGLWIPNTEQETWNPSHPEHHTEMLVGTERGLRVHRAHIIRLAKAAVANDGDARVMISFNIEALALEIVAEARPLPEALRDFFLEAGHRISASLTEDPARVSGKIKLAENISQTKAAARLHSFASCIAAAIPMTDEAQAAAKLSEMYAPQLPGSQPRELYEIAQALNAGTGAVVPAAFGVAAARAKTGSRAFGRAQA